ncbi:hypothetical protein [Halorubrum tropicale]|uniref:hypothetical protein n=1 Tax=Halorubrum tropicale TaxID=1765655 RepID=UPI000AC0E6F1|nr:hypothetical protein [Halorubrum tropicale]
MLHSEEELEDLSEEEILDEMDNGFQSRDSKIFQTFEVLVDRNWHCRHEYEHINSDQPAGGGGIQGLEGGTKSRPGLEIESENQHCDDCDETKKHDRWTGEFKTAVTAAEMPEDVKNDILDYYGHRDAIENRERDEHDLIIDHRVPMARWGEEEEAISEDISDQEIQRKFQLLKHDIKGNHNLLKSRACEHCMETGERGTPLGIKFWYRGGPEWPEDVPEEGEEAEIGCVGCGWYNFDKWRSELNQHLEETVEYVDEEIDLEGTLLEESELTAD